MYYEFYYGQGKLLPSDWHQAEKYKYPVLLLLGGGGSVISMMNGRVAVLVAGLFWSLLLMVPCTGLSGHGHTASSHGESSDVGTYILNIHACFLVLVGID